MCCRRVVGLAIFFAGVLSGAPLGAASFQLTPKQIDEAILVGRESVVSEVFDREWQVVNADGASVSVVTPFHRLALAARNAAFKEESLKPREIAKVLRENRGRLSFWVTVRGSGEEFARRYQALLLARGKEIKASFIQNEQTARREEGGRYVARCLYSFPTADLDPYGGVTLVVRDHGGRNVARFNIDLAAMR